MNKKCKLDPSINNCHHFEIETQLCENENLCSFQEEIQVEPQRKEYKRPDRWYKKYYDNENYRWK